MSQENTQGQTRAKNNVQKDNSRLHNQLAKSSNISAKVAAIPYNFNYQILNKEDAQVLQEATSKIRSSYYHGLDSFIKSGKFLYEMHERIEFGHWQMWIEQEFVQTGVFTLATANHLLRTYARLKEADLLENPSLRKLSKAALLVVTEPSVTTEQMMRVMDYAKNGQQISAEMAKVVIDDYKYIQMIEADLAPELRERVAKLNITDDPRQLLAFCKLVKRYQLEVLETLETKPDQFKTITQVKNHLVGIRRETGLQTITVEAAVVAEGELQVEKGDLRAFFLNCPENEYDLLVFKFPLRRELEQTVDVQVLSESLDYAMRCLKPGSRLVIFSTSEFFPSLFASTSIIPGLVHHWTYVIKTKRKTGYPEKNIMSQHIYSSVFVKNDHFSLEHEELDPESEYFEQSDDKIAGFILRQVKRRVNPKILYSSFDEADVLKAKSEDPGFFNYSVLQKVSLDSQLSCFIGAR